LGKGGERSLHKKRTAERMGVGLIKDKVVFSVFPFCEKKETDKKGDKGSARGGHVRGEEVAEFKICLLLKVWSTGAGPCSF